MLLDLNLFFTIDPAECDEINLDGVNAYVDGRMDEYERANGDSHTVAQNILLKALEYAGVKVAHGGNALNFTASLLALRRGLPSTIRHDRLRLILPNDPDYHEFFKNLSGTDLELVQDDEIQPRVSFHVPMNQPGNPRTAMLSSPSIDREKYTGKIRELRGDTRLRALAVAFPSDHGDLLLPSSAAMKELQVEHLQTHDTRINEEEFVKILLNSGVPLPSLLQKNEHSDSEELELLEAARYATLRDFDSIPLEQKKEIVDCLRRIYDTPESRRAMPAPDSDSGHRRLLSVGIGPAGCVSVHRTMDGLIGTFASSFAPDDLPLVRSLLAEEDMPHFSTQEKTGRGDACAAIQYLCDRYGDDLLAEFNTPSFPRQHRMLKIWFSEVLGRIAPAIVAQTSKPNLAELSPASASNILQYLIQELRKNGGDYKKVHTLGRTFSSWRIAEE